VTKIVVFDVPDQGYIQEMVDYITNTLGHGAAIERVTGVEQMFDVLLKLAPSKGRLPANQRIRRLIIVGHGGRGGKIGGAVKMVPPAPGGKGAFTSPQARWVSPAEVLKFANSSPKAARVRKEVMARGATAEFWGCNIGAYSAAMRAWSKATGATFRATSETFKTRARRFGYKPQTPHEIVNAVNIPGVGARYVPQRTAEVYGKHNKALTARFDAWLLQGYKLLSATGEIVETKPAKRDKRKRLAYMRALFDRSRGTIRSVEIRVRRPGKGQSRFVRPTQKQMRRWFGLWKTQSFSP
jgi:hypothetical protein